MTGASAGVLRDVQASGEGGQTPAYFGGGMPGVAAVAPVAGGVVPGLGAAPAGVTISADTVCGWPMARAGTS